MEKKTIHFLVSSVCGIFVFCIVIFSAMISHMRIENEKSMNQVCQLYMSEMSHQIEAHFRSVSDLRLAMEEAIARRYPPENVAEYSQVLVDELTFAAQIRGYEFAALYSGEGSMDIVYGENIDIVNEEAFRRSLDMGEQKLTSGVSEFGKVFLLFGTEAAYPMKDGGKSMALIVGLPIEYLNYAMYLDTGESLVYSHIIRKDGSFVLRNENNDSDNYFDWMLRNGSFEEQTSEEVVEEFREAVENGEEYSVVATVNGQRRNIYCEPLKKTEWVLVTVMLHGTLDKAVFDLGKSHLRDAVAACVLILAALLAVYVIYLRMSLAQIRGLREARQEAEHANKAKSQFLSNMSHDIRTPMNAIIGMTNIADSNMDKPELVQECLRKITLSSRHLLGLINDVLDMSKIESGKLTLSVKEVSLRDAFESIVNIISPQIKEKRQCFDIFIRNIQAEDVFCDDVRLNQVLINLLSNAVKFTPEEGFVYVTLMQENSPLGENYVRTHIRVKDSGIGMSEEFRKNIFDAFTREKTDHVHHTEGTGLGMAITKYIVDEMKGTIEVNSEPGRGSEFHVVLDLEKVRVQERNMTLPDKDMLVVDDDEQMCESTVKNLKEIGISAESAQSGEEAVEMVRKRHEAGRDYQFVLLDWQMPGMDGIETARKLREQVGRDVPILMMSAYDWSDIEEAAREAGISGFVSKPLFKSTLYHSLADFMEENSQPQQTEQEDVEEKEPGNRKLLVAEDYDMNWEIIETLLPDAGYQVERAEDGQICVEKFKASEAGEYAAVLMDIRMPVMNGYEATKIIRASGRPDSDLPIIAMTADAFSDDIRRCMDCGMNAHVAKPIDMRELLNVIRKFL